MFVVWKTTRDFDDLQTCIIGALTTMSRSNWGDLDGPQRNLDHGEKPLRHVRDEHDLDELPRNSPSGPYRPRCRASGPAKYRREHSARHNTKQNQPEPDDNVKEHSARSMTCKTSPERATAGVDDERTIVVEYCPSGPYWPRCQASGASRQPKGTQTNRCSQCRRSPLVALPDGSVTHAAAWRLPQRVQPWRPTTRGTETSHTELCNLVESWVVVVVVSAVQKTPPMAADDCTVALCVPVSVAKQR